MFVTVKLKRSKWLILKKCMWHRWDYLKMSEGDVDRAAQLLSRRIWDHHRHNFREDLEGGVRSIFFSSFDHLERPVHRAFKVFVAQQCSHSKTCKRSSEYYNIINLLWLELDRKELIFTRIFSRPGCCCPVCVQISIFTGQTNISSWSSRSSLNSNLCIYSSKSLISNHRTLCILTISSQDGNHQVH